MWLDRLKELRKSNGNPSIKVISDGSKVAERTVARIFQGEADHPYVDTLYQIVAFLGGSLDDILSDTKAVVSDQSLIRSQEEIDVIVAKYDLISAENDILKDKVAVLTAENDLLKLKLSHKEEIIALHNYYNKVEQSSQK